MKFLKSNFTPLVILYVISSSIRLLINFSTEFIPGANGAFYLANVRSIIEDGTVFFKDFPLIFWIEAFVAKAIYFLGIAEIEKAIDLTCRLVDSLIPPLAIIPAYYLVKQIQTERENKFPTILFSSLSILFISFLILVSDFQKNSLGIVWLFCLMLWVQRSLEVKKITNYAAAFIFFILTGFTHFGCFSVAIFYIILVVGTKYLLRKKLSIKPLLITFIIIAVSYFIIKYVSPPRLKIILDFPLNIFSDPVITLFLQGEPVISPIDLVSMLLINLTGITALIIYIRNNISLVESEKVFFLSLIVLTLFLAFPFIGIEWSQRLTYIAYVPAVPLIAFVYSRIKTRRIKNIVLVIVVAVISISAIVRINIKPVSNMSRGPYAELQILKERLSSDRNILLVARHGLEWWASYILQTNVILEKALLKVYWKRFDNMLFLVQKKEKSPFGPAGVFGLPFREPVIPDSSKLIFEGKYFNLYKSPVPPKDMSIFIERRK
ncbi:MAG: hypothetical protein RDU14_06135 [Melioribacteraceae bacterium]|nr:hypothetical protein [Melioribacteraceae bacterium]